MTRTRTTHDTHTARGGSASVLTQIRGKIRRTPEGVEKQRLELLAAQIENGAPPAFIQRQVEILAATAGK